MTVSRDRLVLIVAAILVVSAALFATGAVIEHSQRGEEHVAEAGASLEGQAESAGESRVENEAHSEEIAGIDPETWPLVGLAIAGSLILAALAVLRGGRWLILVLLFALAFAAADVRELVHQLNESRTTVAVIAAVLITLHLLAASAALAAVRPSLTRTALRPR